MEEQTAKPAKKIPRLAWIAVGILLAAAAAFGVANAYENLNNLRDNAGACAAVCEYTPEGGCASPCG